MFAVNLKSLIFCDSFKLTKNVVCCSVFRNTLSGSIPTKSISHRYFTVNLPGNAIQRSVILPVKGNKVVYRQVGFKSSKSSQLNAIKWKTVGIVAVFGAAFLFYFSYIKNKKLKAREASRHRELGKAKLGGSFDLVDQDNKPLKSEDLLGNWLLIYFGFTHCPDICPDELEKMVQVIDEIDERQDMEKVKAVFITVDPERDTPSVIKKYLKEFSEKMIGLTGTTEQIGAVCKAYRVYFSPGPKDSDADYIVDHSIIMYLVDPSGNFMDYYGQNRNAKEIVSSIRFNQLKKTSEKSWFTKAMDYISKE